MSRGSNVRSSAGLPRDERAPDEDWARIERAVSLCLESGERDRNEILAELSPEALLQATELLEAREGCAESFLARPALALLSDSPADVEETTPVVERIGPYKIEKVLGVGGMGVVYEGVRDGDELRKRVAVKVMHPHLQNAVLAARFRAEAQILAALEHEHIARVFEAGTTDDGTHFLAMEYVRGPSIDAYCDDNELGARERIELFLQACDAVAFAHRHLVVHCDLKPQNILVTGQGVKLLDFGVATLLQPGVLEDGERDSLRSQLRSDPRFRMFTLGYASPEQLAGQKCTTTSDVFSLGVVLYRLLAGKLPFDRARGNESSTSKAGAQDEFPALAREPRPASTRAAGQPDPVGSCRLGADLRAILRRALARDSDDRYSSVADLASDLRRHLDGYPVEARLPCRTYQIGRFVQRHRSAAVISALGALGLGVALLGLVAAKGEADQQRVRAETERDRSRRIESTVVGLFEDMATDSALDPIARVEALEQRARVAIRQLDGQRSTQMALRVAIGSILRHFGSYEAADKDLSEAVDWFAARPSSDPIRAARAHQELGRLRVIQDRPEEAGRLFRSALELIAPGTALGGAEGDLDGHGSQGGDRSARTMRAQPTEELAVSVTTDLATLYREEGRPEESLKAYEDAEARLGQMAEPDPILVSSVLHGRGVLVAYGGDWEAAARKLSSSLEIRRRVLGDEDLATAEVARDLSRTLVHLARLEEAEELAESAMRVAQRLVRPDHEWMGVARNGLAKIRRAQGRPGEALEHAEAAQEIFEKSLGPTHTYSKVNLDLLLELARDEAKFDLASRYLERTVAAMRRSPRVPATDLAGAVRGLGLIRYELGRYSEARSSFQEALDIFASHHGADHPDVAVCLRYLGVIEGLEGRFDQGEVALRRALALRQASYGSRHHKVGLVLSSLGDLFWEAGKVGEAAHAYGQARAILEADSVSDPEALAAAISGEARTRLARGDVARAEDLAVEGLRLRESAVRPGHSSVAASLELLAQVELERGALDSAALHAANAVEVRRRLVEQSPDGELVRCRLAASRLLEVEVLRRRGEPDAARVAAQEIATELEANPLASSVLEHRAVLARALQLAGRSPAAAVHREAIGESGWSLLAPS